MFGKIYYRLAFIKTLVYLRYKRSTRYYCIPIDYKFLVHKMCSKNQIIFAGVCVSLVATVLADTAAPHKEHNQLRHFRKKSERTFASNNSKLE